ncbi:MAG TPA: 16S rRNA (adenine(1518)-N(6)/adenine(1519)-N(6))-dimethyltransferase RsmA [Verrucomicrobiota bacterium]|nr:16S rRNA (adenine(1518)-N(6)/adenine(1519)-N(6))-dimethyltransferase RsmA [Verrucomicrobiota bacterium]
MRSLLAEHNIRLTKSLGQNFLYDVNQIHKIVSSADIQKDDNVLEIGPGLGPLTEHLIPRARLVMAVEKDRRLAELLKQRFADAKNFQLFCDDALEFVKNKNWNDWIVVSNLPYSVASPILVELSKNEYPPKKLTVTVQLEVAQRIIAKHAEDDYGLLSLFIQLRYLPQGFFKIPASCFFPAPKVDSVCITMTRRDKDLLTNDQRELFYKIIKRAFSQRRKIMMKLLKSDFPNIKDALAALNIPTDARGESISLNQYVELAKFIFSQNNIRDTLPE